MADMNAALVIPSLNPDQKILKVITDAIDAGFQHIILVDDGSDDAHKHFFAELDKHPEVKLLTHEVNRGKGEGLKTAFRYYREHLMDTLSGVVTADGDGQHTTKDILRCTAEMEKTQHVVFGCRDFNQPDVPKKSRFGNHTTSAVFKLACGMVISDTQTGLRAIPNCYMDAMIDTYGSRFEYETNMILEMNRLDIPLTEVKIETVYEDNNSGTHFRPVHDSVRIYKLILKYMFSANSKFAQIFKYACSSLSCFVIDFGINLGVLELIHRDTFSGAFGDFVSRFPVAVAYIIARVFSSIFNFFINRNVVFKSRESLGKSLGKYYALCVPQAIAGVSLTWLLSSALEATAPLLNSGLKFIVDVCLFILSFIIQRVWVFKKK